MILGRETKKFIRPDSQPHVIELAYRRKSKPINMSRTSLRTLTLWFHDMNGEIYTLLYSHTLYYRRKNKPINTSHLSLQIIYMALEFGIQLEIYTLYSRSLSYVWKCPDYLPDIYTTASKTHI